jgi:lipid II:glycine glycyltransferase (peptidoglycan interpeptide bridge formation enzyme)
MNQKDSLPYPFTFYKNEFDLLYPNNFNIIFIENEERCIGAGIVFIYEERKAIYMAGVALDRTVSSRYKIYYKLRWETVKYAHRNGFRRASLEQNFIWIIFYIYHSTENCFY